MCSAPSATFHRHPHPTHARCAMLPVTTHRYNHIRPEVVGWHPRCDLAPQSTSFGTVALRERQHLAMAGSEHFHYPHNATAHHAARTNSHSHFGAQTRRLRSGHVDWRSFDGEQSARGYVRALGLWSGIGTSLVSAFSNFQSKRRLPVDYVPCCRRWQPEIPELLRVIKKIRVDVLRRECVRGPFIRFLFFLDLAFSLCSSRHNRSGCKHPENPRSICVSSRPSMTHRISCLRAVHVTALPYFIRLPVSCLSQQTRQQARAVTDFSVLQAVFRHFCYSLGFCSFHKFRLQPFRPRLPARVNQSSCQTLPSDDLCVLFETPWCGARVHCLIWPHLRPSGAHPMWCWRDTRVGPLIRLCGQILRTLSVVLVLVCLPACGVQDTGSVSVSALSLVRKWLLVDLLGDDFRKLSSYSSQSTEPC